MTSKTLVQRKCLITLTHSILMLMILVASLYARWGCRWLRQQRWDLTGQKLAQVLGSA